jgi:hypothetical protein
MLLVQPLQLYCFEVMSRTQVCCTTDTCLSCVAMGS